MSDRLRRYKSVRNARAADHPEERMGQCYFNALYAVEPELADEIRGTADDPFYDDGCIPEFMGLVCARLA